MTLNYKRTFFVGLAFFSIIAFWEMYDGLVPKILDETFHMKETSTGVVMALDNVLALFLLPLMGSLSDKVNTRLGKRMPFILGGTLLASVFILIMPFAEANQNKVLFLTALGVVLLAMGLYRSPAVALMPDITPKPLRSKANAIINLMGTLGGAYTLLAIRFLYKDGQSKFPVFLAVVLLMLLAVCLLAIMVNENKLADQMRGELQEHEISQENDGIQSGDEGKSSKIDVGVRRSFIYIMASIFLWFFAYNAVKTAFSRYADKVWGMGGGEFSGPLMVAMVAALICYIPIGILSSKMGRKKMIVIGVMIMTFSYGIGFTITDYSFLVNVVFAMTGIGWAAINVNSYPMVVEMCKGSDTGKYTGYYYTFSMAAQIITPIASGFLLQHVSYRTLFPYAFIFSIASLCTMLMVKHGDSKPPKSAGLIEHFDTED